MVAVSLLGMVTQIDNYLATDCPERVGRDPITIGQRTNYLESVESSQGCSTVATAAGSGPGLHAWVPHGLSFLLHYTRDN